MSDSNTAVAGSGLPILAAVCLAALILPLSFSAGAVATPAIARQLGGNPAGLVWITNAFMLTFGSSLMAVGALADEYGRKRVFAAGVGLFGMISVALAAAPTVLWIDILRGLQGFAAAAALAGGSASLAQALHGRALTRAFTALGTSFGVGLAFGPLLAGWLIDAFGWRSIFLCIAAVACLAFAFGVPRMRESRDPDASGLDWPGALTFSAGLVSFTYAIVQGPSSGWGDPMIVGLLCAASLLLAAFVWIELRVGRPMLDLSLFRYARFVGVQAMPIGTCYCYIVLLILLPVRFIGINGMRAFDAGWLMLALSAPMLFIPSLAALITRWIAPGWVAGAGLLIAAIGVALLSRLSISETGLHLQLLLLMIGCGTGLPWGLMDGLSISVVPKDRAGMATGIFSTTRVAGESMALAIATAILATSLKAKLTTDTLAGSSIKMQGENFTARAMQAGVQLASGELNDAHRLLPEVARSALVKHYGEAFNSLLLILAAITLTSAVVTLACLAPRRRTSES